MSTSSEASKRSTNSSLGTYDCTPITQSQLKDLLEYDPLTGIFKHHRTGKGIRSSRLAGYTKKSSGYNYIKIDYKPYLSHRLAWIYVHGVFPTRFISHINDNKSDNRIANLRETNEYQIHQRELRKRKDGASTYRGVIRAYAATEKTKKPWIANIKSGGKAYNLGVFATEIEAHAAYCAAADKYHKEFANHG